MEEALVGVNHRRFSLSLEVEHRAAGIGGAVVRLRAPNPSATRLPDRVRALRRHTHLGHPVAERVLGLEAGSDRKSTRLNSSHTVISYAVFCLKKKNTRATDIKKP